MDDLQEHEDDSADLDPNYDPMADDHKQAHYVEVDRVVKLYQVKEIEWMRSLGKSLMPSPYESCSLCADLSVDELPCQACQVQTWIGELILSMATQIEAGGKADEKHRYREGREMVGPKLTAFFGAMQATCEKYPANAHALGQRIRDRAMHQKCRDMLARHKEEDACDMCGLALVMSGGLLHVGKAL